MIAFGSAVTDQEQYRRFAGPGIELVREPDSQVFANVGAGTLFRNYNLLLDLARDREDLEALVLLHQDTEIVDPNFCAKLRAALAGPSVGVVGCVGSIGVRSIAWWEGAVTWGSFVHRYYELGGGDLPALTWESSRPEPTSRLGEVDTVDGFLMVLSPWVVRNLRFDESLGRLHGYDFDFCLQVREAGHKVVTADFKAIHHHSLDLVSDPETWIAAHMRVAEKWDGRIPGVGSAPGDWKQRARHAEAESAVRQALLVARSLQYDAQLNQLERELEVMRESIGWRVTEPLRRANHWRKRLTGKDTDD